MSRWKYKTATVTVGENSQDVRQLTQKERGEFAAASKQIKEGKLQAMDLPPMVVKFAAINPQLTADDLESMPPDLMDECCRKVMELSGMRDEEPDADPEKKDS